MSPLLDIAGPAAMGAAARPAPTATTTAAAKPSFAAALAGELAGEPGDMARPGTLDMGAPQSAATAPPVTAPVTALPTAEAMSAEQSAAEHRESLPHALPQAAGTPALSGAAMIALESAQAGPAPGGDAAPPEATAQDGLTLPDAATIEGPPVDMAAGAPTMAPPAAAVASLAQRLSPDAGGSDQPGHHQVTPSPVTAGSGAERGGGPSPANAGPLPAASAQNAKSEAPAQGDQPSSAIGQSTLSGAAPNAGGSSIGFMVGPLAGAAPVTPDASAVQAPLAPPPPAERQLDLIKDANWLGTVASDIAAARGKDGALTFRLLPNQLGRIDVSLTPGTSGMVLHIAAETDAARGLLAGGHPRLVAELSQSGVQVEKANYVTLSAQDGGSGGRGGQQHGAQEQADRRANPAPMPLDAPKSTQMPARADRAVARGRYA
jgi:flagellar hook-length control protein FliK